jgi:thiol-disulfide isomerase/thioredoxin
MLRFLTICLIVLILGLSNISAAGSQGFESAPAFNISDSNGLQHQFPSRDKGVDVYLFWATWCPYCKALMPHLQSIQHEYGADVRVFALHIRDDEDPVGFMNKQGYDFTVLPSADSVMDRYGVRGTPAIFLVDANGKIRFNLYDVIIEVPGAKKSSSHKFKATRKAPYWAARIRQNIDDILTSDRAEE